jgi:hypothetical protein
MKGQAVEQESKDPVLLRAAKEPSRWELICPECGLRVNVLVLLGDDGDISVLRNMICPRHPLTFMVLKPIRSNLGGLLFLIWEVIRGYFSQRV